MINRGRGENESRDEQATEEQGQMERRQKERKRFLATRSGGEGELKNVEMV